MAADPSPRTTTLRRAVFITSLSSFLVPVGGLLTQPVLAQALGADGRGLLAAAIAPAFLVGAIASFGLPEALVYTSATRPWVRRKALLWAAAILVATTIPCVLVAALFLPIMSAGDTGLARLMFFSMVLVFPFLLVGLLRGVASGAQMWGTVAIEGCVTTLLRVVSLVALWQTGHLTPTTGVLVTFLAPALAGLSYVRLLGRPPNRPADAPDDGGILRPLGSFAARSWVGTVASTIQAFIHPILMTPLASVRGLGLFSVASTVMDVPIVLSRAVGSTLFGFSSKSTDPHQIARTSRMIIILTVALCLAMGATCPWWVPWLFGQEFDDAVLPTQLLLVSAAIYIPGPLAGAGLAAAGRPGTSSVVFLGSMIASITLFLVLVPAIGFIGACYAGIIASSLQTTLLIYLASRHLRIPATKFVVPERSDFHALAGIASGAISAVRHTTSGRFDKIRKPGS